MSMHVPVSITFLGMTRSPYVEAQIQRWVKKLEKSYDRIQRCSAWIELPHHRGEKSFHVRVEVAVPGETLVSRDNSHGNVYAALSGAFRAARRQVQDHVRIQRGD
jgi:ribosome-associated translation inhibitor RaiA